ncbi:MAG: hypothetical protein GY733_10220 [bacterium]|nr:hypothetical protein [bacterium]
MNTSRMRIRRAALHLAAVFALVAVALVVVAPAGALEVGAPAAEVEPSLAQKARFAYWRGRTCMTPGCKAGRPGSVTDVASFAVAAFGGVLLSRRRAR